MTRTVHWTRRPATHPTWCGQGHACSIDRPAGEHRSHPITVHTRHARLVATRIRTHAGADRLEIRAVLDLPTDPAHAQAMARLFLLRLQHALAATHLSGGIR